MSFGLNSTGFNRPTLQDLLDAVAAEYTSTIGPVNDADDSVFSQVIRPPLTQFALGWEVLEAVYQALSVNGAAGVSLDSLVGLNFITRLSAQKTSVVVKIEGDIGAEVETGDRASIGANGAIFESTGVFIIDATNAMEMTFEVLTAAYSTHYIIRINDTYYDYTSPPSGTNTHASIAQGLADLAAADGAVTITDNLDGTLTIVSADLNIPFSGYFIGSSSLAEMNGFKGYGRYEAIETGAIACPAGSLDTIETPRSGVTSITNPIDGVLGRDRETDKDLRTRRNKTLARGGKATNAAILAKMLSGDIEGITQAYVYENNTDSVDAYGRPAHSIEVVVEGGDNEAIAKAIHSVRASGIVTFGNVNGSAGITFVDDQGFETTVKFSRPVPKYAWVKVDYELYDEEIFPDDGEQLIAAAILELGNTMTIGKDFILQRFINPAVVVEGIGNVLLTIAITSSALGTPSYSGSNIAIGPSEVLVFDSTRITVEPAS